MWFGEYGVRGKALGEMGDGYRLRGANRAFLRDRADGVTAVGAGESADGGSANHAVREQITGSGTNESSTERLAQIPLEIRSPRGDRAFALGDRVLTALVSRSRFARGGAAAVENA